MSRSYVHRTNLICIVTTQLGVPEIFWALQQKSCVRLSSALWISGCWGTGAFLHLPRLPQVLLEASQLGKNYQVRLKIEVSERWKVTALHILKCLSQPWKIQVCFPLGPKSSLICLYNWQWYRELQFRCITLLFLHWILALPLLAWCTLILGCWSCIILKCKVAE